MADIFFGKFSKLISPEKISSIEKKVEKKSQNNIFVYISLIILIVIVAYLILQITLQ